MKHEIIKTDNYLLAVGKDRKRGWFYCVRTKSFFHDEGEDVLCCNGDLPIDAHLPLNGSPALEGVDLLPPLGDEVEKMAFEKFSNKNPTTFATRAIWIDGYNQAKEKYKYTEEDLRKAIDRARDYCDGWVETKDEIVQSLSQPKMPIGFECEMEDTFTDGYTYDRVRRFYGKKPKTTTTPEGHTQWVGTYIYV